MNTLAHYIRPYCTNEFQSPFNKSLTTCRANIQFVKDNPHLTKQYRERCLNLFIAAVLTAPIAPTVCLAAFSFTIWSVTASAALLMISFLASKHFYQAVAQVDALKIDPSDIESLEKTLTLCTEVINHFNNKQWVDVIVKLEGLRYDQAMVTSYSGNSLSFQQGLDDYLSVSYDRMDGIAFEKLKRAIPADEIRRLIPVFLGTSYLNHAIDLSNQGNANLAKEMAKRAEYWLKKYRHGLDASESQILEKMGIKSPSLL